MIEYKIIIYRTYVIEREAERIKKILKGINLINNYTLDPVPIPKHNFRLR